MREGGRVPKRASFSERVFFQATDEEGKGHSSSAPLKITLTDSNDNFPIFNTLNYTAVIEEGATKFEPPFFVKVSSEGVLWCVVTA